MGLERANYTTRNNTRATFAVAVRFGVAPTFIKLDHPLEESRRVMGEVEEIILATNPTIEGEATAQYICDLASNNGIRTTRIAHGVPLGGELEYLDGGTLAHAFSGRRELS